MPAAMKASKFLVLAGGLLGILAFFLPMVTVHRSGYEGSVSAFQIIKGLNVASDAMASDEVRHAAMSSEAYTSAKDGVDQMKGIVMAIFIPAILLAALGALGVAKKKFGRGIGAVSFLLGLVGLGIGALLKSAAGADGGIGLTLLLATGALGTVGGLFALVKPDRGLAATPAAA